MNKRTNCILRWLIVCYCLPFSSCHKVKSDEIKVTITVKEYKTDKPIANAIVSITIGKNQIGTNLVATLTTNENGEAFYDEIVSTFDYNYYCQARKEGYIDEGTQAPISIGKDKQKQVLTLYTESYVKLHVKNVNPFNQSDLISFNSACNTYTIAGTADSTFLWCYDCDCKWYGNYNHTGGAFITKNGKDTTVHFNFETRPYDTITVNINY